LMYREKEYNELKIQHRFSRLMHSRVLNRLSKKDGATCSKIGMPRA
jgi:hypothetical protein